MKTVSVGLQAFEAQIAKGSVYAMKEKVEKASVEVLSRSLAGKERERRQQRKGDVRLLEEL